MEIEMGKKALKILHFADAHIDIAQQGKHDAASGLPVRVVDFLKALDTIIDAAISEKVDLVLFAGDAYKDRLPAPTFQREWGRRIMRLSNAKIPTLLLVGNHDLSPASGRAHTLQEFDTLEVPNVRVLGKPEFLKPADLWGLPLQVLALPWVFRSGLMATLDLTGADADKINEELEVRLTEILQEWMSHLDPGTANHSGGAWFGAGSPLRQRAHGHARQGYCVSRQPGEGPAPGLCCARAHPQTPGS